MSWNYSHLEICKMHRLMVEAKAAIPVGKWYIQSVNPQRDYGALRLSDRGYRISYCPPDSQIIYFNLLVDDSGAATFWNARRETGLLTGGVTAYSAALGAVSGWAKNSGIVSEGECK